MAVSPFKTFSGGEILTASDLNSSITQITDNGEDLGWPATKAKDLNGQSLVLDADADTSITSTTDDQIDFELGGTDLFRMKTVASAVNGLDFLASATGNDVDIVAFGTDTNIDIQFSPKGSGDIFKDSNLIFHAGNDGSGSGLDADTLDGVEGASFLRSDVTDTVSAVQTHTAIPSFNGGSSGSTAPFDVDSTFVVSNLNADLLDGITASKFVRSDIADTVAGVLTHTAIPAFNGGSSGSTAPFTVDSNFVVTNLNAERLGSIGSDGYARSNVADTISGVHTHTARPAFDSTGAPFTVTSNTVVTNLNADLLDGVSGGSFARSDAADTISAVQTHTARPAFNSTGAPFTVTSTTVVSNLNADLLDGISSGNFARSNVADTISGVLTHTARPVFNGGATGVNSPFTVDSTFVVTNLNADLLDGNSASAFLTAGGKAVDSELLDGIDSLSFARSDAADTISGVLTHTARPVFNGGATGVNSPFTVDSTFVVTNLNADLLDGVQGASFARSDAADTISAVQTHTARPAFNSTGAPFTVNSSTVVSGLNADQLDGLTSAQFCRLDVVSIFTARPNFDGGLSGTSSPFTVDSTQVVTNLNADLLDGLDSNNFLRSDTADTVAGVLTHTARPAFNSTGAPFTVNSSTVVSGLNADQLDGISSASFLRSDATDTVSAVQTHTAIPAFNGGLDDVSAPFTVDSDFKVTNLNADKLDGLDISGFVRTATTAVKTAGSFSLNDNIVLGIGGGASSTIGQFFSDGSNMFLDLLATTGKDWFIRDGTTSRYLFDKDEGDFHADGDIIAFSTSVGSDPKLKKNIEPLENGLQRVLALRGVSFNWKKNGEASAGLLSTDVGEVLPSAVKKIKCRLGDLVGKTREHVNYNQVIGLLVEAIRDLDGKITYLENA